MIKPILLVEDNPKDLELTLLALAKSQLANEVVTVRDGVEVLDYLFCRGEYAGRPSGNPAVVLLDLKLPKVDGLEVLEQIKRDSGSKASQWLCSHPHAKNSTSSKATNSESTPMLSSQWDSSNSSKP